MKRLSILGIVFSLALALAILFAANSRTFANGTVASTTVPYPHPTSFVPSSSGTTALDHEPAVHPSSQKIQANVLPTFATADVEQYLLTDPTIGMDAAKQKLTHTITFVSSQTLGPQLSTNFSGDASILCYIEFKGSQPFVLSSVHSLTPLHFTSAFEVLDGRTGDLIMWGGRH